jgi:hypothetical protein
VQLFGRLSTVMVQRYCALCGKTFEIERKAGRPRKYCPECSPPGFQVVKLPYRTKLRRRPPLCPRPGKTSKINKNATRVAFPQWDGSA